MQAYTSATVKGQVLIPIALRRKFGIKAGTRIHVFEENGRIVLQPVTREQIRRVRGLFKGAGALKALMAERKRERHMENGKSAARVR
jgi:AbrB family looped-hinge helix DNA binding protein